MHGNIKQILIGCGNGPKLYSKSLFTKKISPIGN